MRHIDPTTLSTPRGYSHVVEVTGGRTLYVSGQIALDRDGNVVGPDFAAQTLQVFENLKDALAAGGATFADVVKLTVFLTDAEQIQTYRQIRDRYITGSPPASTLVQVVRLARPELMIEIEAIAVVEARSD
jgi:reactive intermediate/imine deaminase